MIVELLKTGRRMTVTQDEYDNLIVNNGHAYKYRIVEDEAPFEVKQMRAKFDKKKKDGKENA